MGFRKVLVAVNPTGDGQAAIVRCALNLSGTEGGRLMILGCLESDTAAGLAERVGTLAEVNSSASLNVRRQRLETEKEHLAAWLEDLAREARQSGREVNVTVAVGKPGPQICETAAHWKAEVIVLGLTRRGELAERLLGSVTHHVAHHAPCSVLMVHG